MTWNLKTLAVLTVAVGSLSACGGGSSTPASSATSTTSAAAAPTSAAAAANSAAAAPTSASGSSVAPTSAAAATSAAVAAPTSAAAGTGSTSGCGNAAVAVNKATNASPQSQLVFSIDLSGGCSTIVITSGIAKGDAAAVTLCNTVAPVSYANGVGAVKILATDGTSAAATGKKGSACVSG